MSKALPYPILRRMSSTSPDRAVQCVFPCRRQRGTWCPWIEVQPDSGIFAYQIRTTPSNQSAILVTRGNNAREGKPEDPGALKVFGLNNGVLTNQASVAPGTGLGFGPRHLDFHPQQAWVFVSIERQNQLYVSKLQPDNFLAPDPCSSRQHLPIPAMSARGRPRVRSTTIPRGGSSM